MVHHNREEVEIKTFNAAKLFIETVIFPLISKYKQYKRISNFGSDDINEANNLPEDIREINRYNGAKGMAETALDLADAITSTVRLHNNEEEKEMLDKIKINLKKIIDLFYNNKEKFFTPVHKNNKTIEIINRKYFEQVRDIIGTSYINIEILMTKNKLLFSDSKDDFATDSEIKEQIMKDYTE